jgi:hypothetical protein
MSMFICPDGTMMPSCRINGLPGFKYLNAGFSHAPAASPALIPMHIAQGNPKGPKAVV